MKTVTTEKLCYLHCFWHWLCNEGIKLMVTEWNSKMWLLELQAMVGYVTESDPGVVNFASG